MNREKQLIVKLTEGSYPAFTQLYETYLPQLYGFALRALKSRPTASDIVQETFIRIWENRSTLNPELSFKSYLFTITNSLIITEYRKQINRPELAEYMEFINHTALSEDTTQQQIDFNEFLLRLEKAKKKLSPRQREIFVLAKECGMTSLQIAAQLAISDQVVRNQLSAAMKTIRKELIDYLPLLLIIYNF